MIGSLITTALWIAAMTAAWWCGREYERCERVAGDLRMPAQTDRKVIVLVRNGHRFVFTHDGSQDDVAELLRTFGRYASDPELPEFDWCVAAELSRRVKADSAGEES